MLFRSLVYAYCSQFFREFNCLYGQLHPEAVDQEKEKLRVSTQNNIAQTIIPVWLGAIFKGAPNIDVDIQIKDDVVTGHSDAGFILLFKKGDEI